MKDIAAPALPETCSWLRVEELVQQASTMVAEVSKAAVDKVHTALEQAMNVLDTIAYGGADGVPWYNAYRDDPSPSTWDSSVAILNRAGAKKLDAAVALCEKQLAAAARVSDTFSPPSCLRRPLTRRFADHRAGQVHEDRGHHHVHLAGACE